MKKGVKKKTVKIILSDRWLYTLITIGILIILSVGISAVLGATPNPGHATSELQTCSEGEILKMVNGAWTCATAQTSGACPAGTHIVYEDSNSIEDYRTTPIKGSIGKDTCDKNMLQKCGYICAPGESNVYIDTWYDKGYYHQDVVCKKNMIVRCLED